VAAFLPLRLGGTGFEVWIPGAVRTASVGAQFQGGALRLLETRRSHRAVAGRLGKGMGEKFATQCATDVGAGGFPAAVGCRRAIELTRGDGTGDHDSNPFQAWKGGAEREGQR